MFVLTKKSRGKELAAAVMVVRSVLDRFRRAILPHRPVIFILILFSFALLLRLIYLSQINASPFFNNPVLDSKEYDQWAKEIVNGKHLWDGFKIHAPLYPYFLAGCYWLFGKDHYYATLVQFFVGSINCVLIYLIGKKIFNECIGRMASFMAAAYGVFIYFEGQLLYPFLAIFLNLSLILSLLTTRERPTNKNWLVSGFILGLSAATKPLILFLVPFLLTWIILEFGRKRKPQQIAIHGASLCFGVILVVGPIIVRNYHINGYLYPIQGHSALNFYIGNNPESDGTPYIRPGFKWAQLVQWPIEERGLKEKRQHERFFFNKVVQFINEEPASYLSLQLKKLYLFWNGYEIKASQNIYFFDRYSWLMRLPLFSFKLISPLALTGMLLAFPFWKRASPLYLFVLLYQVAVIATVVSDRYRLPVIPFLLIFAAFTVWWCFVKYSEKRYGLLFISFLPMVLFSLVTNSAPWFVRSKINDFSEEYYQLATIYRNVGKYDAAIEQYKRALQENTFLPEAHNSPGMMYHRMGHFEKAFSEYWRGLEIDGNNPRVYR